MTNGPDESTRFHVAADVGDLELLFAWYVNHRFAPHAHEGYSIGVMLRGAMGFDHERLSYRHEGRDHRLTDVFGKVRQELLA